MICSCTDYTGSCCKKDPTPKNVKMGKFSKTSTCETYLGNICNLIRSEVENRKSLNSGEGASIKTLFNDSKSRKIKNKNKFGSILRAADSTKSYSGGGARSSILGTLDKAPPFSEDDFGMLSRNINYVMSDWEQIKCISGKSVRGVQTQYRDPLCRACLATDVPLSDMFSERILGDFIELAGLNMDDLIQVPMMLCESCRTVVDNFIQFRKRCSMANKALLLSVYEERLTTASINLRAAAKSEQYYSTTLEFEPYMLSDNVKRLMESLQQSPNGVLLEPMVHKVDHKLSPFEIRETDEFRLLRPRFGSARSSSRKDKVTDIPILKPRPQSRSKFSRHTPSTLKRNETSNWNDIFSSRTDADITRMTKPNKCKTLPTTLEANEEFIEGDFGKTGYGSQESYLPRSGKAKFCRQLNSVAKDLYQGIDEALFPRYPCGELKEYLDSEIFMPELCGVPASELLKQNGKLTRNFRSSEQDRNMQGSANESSASIFSDSLFGSSYREKKSRGSHADIPPREEITAKMSDIGVDAFDFLVYSLNVHTNKDNEDVHLVRSVIDRIRTPPRVKKPKKLTKDVDLYCSRCELDVPSVQRLVRHVKNCEASGRDKRGATSKSTDTLFSPLKSSRDKTLDPNECHSEQFYDCSEIEFDLDRDNYTEKSMSTPTMLVTTPDLVATGGNDIINSSSKSMQHS